MLKKLFQFSSNGRATAEAPQEERAEDSGFSANAAEWKRTPHAAEFAPSRSDAPAAAKASGFEQIYQSAAVKSPRGSYSILQVSEMLNSPHLAGMTPEGRRCALLMALEAARVDPDQLLQDAMLRQRALNDHEDALEERLHSFEAAKAEENRAIQAELDRITSQHLARIQLNLDAVAHAQDEFREWQEGKQQECQRITDAAGFCVPQNGAPGLSGLAAVLEHAAKPRR
ncbi:MAG TPA: hypothetical protein VMU19_14620 [Bryobacteraceae bacterium]|nr:hypothetical protein [Bryobacteraceae bacterium]